MQRLILFRLILSLTAMLFVAKPFLGFASFNQQYHPKQAHSILVKSFSKRKPESLEEADANAEFIHQLLITPLSFVISTISFLLLTLFPSVFKKCAEITNGFLSDMLYELLPPEHTYLLTGKLII